MDYDLSEKQKILRDEARKLFLERCDSAFIRKMVKDDKGYTQEMWQEMAKRGWMGLLIPKKYGGCFESFMDMIVILHEMGYCCFSGPFFSTAVLGVITLLEMGDDSQKKNILPKTAKGNCLLTLALSEPNNGCSAEEISLRAARRDDYYILNGVKLFVPDAHVADFIFCVTRTEETQKEEGSGISLFIVDRKAPGMSLHPMQTSTGEKLFGAKFGQLRVPKENLLGALNQGWPPLKRVFCHPRLRMDPPCRYRWTHPEGACF